MRVVVNLIEARPGARLPRPLENDFGREAGPHNNDVIYPAAMALGPSWSPLALCGDAPAAAIGPLGLAHALADSPTPIEPADFCVGPWGLEGFAVEGSCDRPALRKIPS